MQCNITQRTNAHTACHLSLVSFFLSLFLFPLSLSPPLSLSLFFLYTTHCFTSFSNKIYFRFLSHISPFFSPLKEEHKFLALIFALMPSGKVRFHIFYLLLSVKYNRLDIELWVAISFKEEISKLQTVEKVTRNHCSIFSKVIVIRIE